MVQEKAKEGIKSFFIGKLTGRDPDSIRKGFPDPCDSRFEHIQSNKEMISKYKNTKATTNFKTLSSRTELWGDPLPQPGYLDNAKTDKRYWKMQGVKPFDPKVPGHIPSGKEKCFTIPDGYTYQGLKRGFEATTHLKKAPSLVNMASSPSRDNGMYQKLDPDYIKQVKR